MSPQKKNDGTVQVSFYYRENGRGTCKDQLSYRCETGYCNNTEDSKPVITDRDSSSQERWCQSEGQARIAFFSKRSISLSCLAGNMVPQYLLPTDSHGTIHQASVGNQFQLHLHAQASEARISDFQSFKFVGDFDQVYITCSVILCETGNPTSRCAQGCVNNPPHRRKRGLSKETASHSVTAGPMKLLREVNSAEPQAKGAAGRLETLLGSHTSSAVLGCLFILTVLVLAGVIAAYIRKSKTQDRLTLITEWDG
ncbi:hypothetical protein NHX12_005509 [Muraenolepis orangiensis]|uniref:ZP domain-containing protein n=1 Tax=Muraenolepis orangiensis TaxID=630683 RepID=A0A9Q0ID07_9TELE|nr:hypothetical protein NHX12_005509 [Muraenolepis orangiensis]